MIFPATALLVLSILITGPAISPSSALTGRVVLRNARWSAVQVEVRIGASSQCDQNESVGIKTLGRDQAWGVVSDQTICWRREQTPGDARAGWTPWSQTRLALDEVRDITL